MALSQLLDDSLQGSGPQHVDDLYNERHRLALEELLSGGLDSFLDFLGKERLPNFLSDDEIQYIRGAAVPPRCAAFHGEDQALEQSLSSSVDCSSVTYFPEVSDVEPPLLEIGWPAFTAGSYRGVTRAVAHFQPSYGENIYSCKEAARRMIKNAKEVIAIVTDSLTDLDIFKDLLEACSNRRVPVYILLDQSCAPAFLKMCRNMAVCLDDLQQMRVRTITGTTYYMRSGAKITGKVHERFMLIDGNRVATGSYRFNWTDGKLNSSNLIELSGQVSEKFDEEFRILYAQSLPINTRGNSSVRNSMVHVPFHLKHSVTSSPHLARENPACLTSTPTRKPQWLAVRLPHEPLTPERSKSKPDSATIDEMEHMQEEILAGGAARPVLQLSEEEPPATVSCHASTQTSRSLTESDTQTDSPLPRPDDPIAPNIADPKDPPSLGPVARAPPDAILKASFCNLSKERQRRYAIIRAKLEHMATSLSQRRELADVTKITRETVTHSRQRTHKDCGQDPDLRMAAGCTGTWPRARCVQ